MIKKATHPVAFKLPPTLDRCKNGKPAYQSPYNVLKCDEAQFLVDYHDYYIKPRGYHPRAVNSGNVWSMTTPITFMNMPIVTYIKEISPRPIPFIHGEKAHSRYFSETVYEAAAKPKELLLFLMPIMLICMTVLTSFRLIR